MSCKSISRTRLIAACAITWVSSLPATRLRRPAEHRWKELSQLLPNVSAHVIENAQNQSLAALGFTKLLPLLSPPGTNTEYFPSRHARLQLL